MRQVDGVLHDIDLGVEVGRDVDRRVGDQERLGVARYVEHKHMADSAFGAQAALRVDHRAQQFVAVQAAFHQRIDLAGAGQLDRLGRRRIAVRNIDYRNAGQVKATFAG